MAKQILILSPAAPTNDVALEFDPTWISVQNGTGNVLFIQEGTQGIPDALSFSYQIPAQSYLTIPIKSRYYGFSLGPLAITAPLVYSGLSQIATIIFGDQYEIIPQASVIQLSAPPQYWDRDPTNATISTIQLLIPGPYAPVPYTNYVVPVGRKAWISEFYSMTFCEVAPAGAGLVAGYLNYTLAAGGTIRLAASTLNAAARGDKNEVNLPMQSLLYAGDKLELVGVDFTNGSYDFFMTALITEFTG